MHISICILQTPTRMCTSTRKHTHVDSHTITFLSLSFIVVRFFIYFYPHPCKKEKKNCTPKNRGVIIIISNNDSRTTVQIRCVCGGAGRGHHLLIRAFTSFLRFFSWVYFFFFFCTFKKVSRKIAKATTLDTRQKKKKKMKSPGDSVIQNSF